MKRIEEQVFFFRFQRARIYPKKSQEVMRKEERLESAGKSLSGGEGVVEGMREVGLGGAEVGSGDGAQVKEEQDEEERLTILADTSYGACCVDEVAAEHVDADVVVHYGRSCLSPPSRLPVIYVFTERELNVDAAITTFEETYPEKDQKVGIYSPPFPR